MYVNRLRLCLTYVHHTKWMGSNLISSLKVRLTQFVQILILIN